MTPSIELVCTGTELLNGRSINTHTRLIARRLAPLGLGISREATVPDDADTIAGTVRAAIARSDVVLVSGGLGPTGDDCTREAVASVFHRSLCEDAPTVERLRLRCAASGRAWSPSRRRQARVIEGADILSNSAGAAPGERVDTDRGALFLFPGPSRELEAVLDKHVLPWLAAQYPDAAGEERILMVAGMGESDIVSRIETNRFPLDGISLAYCASPGRVEVRLTGPAGSGPDMDRAADRLAGILGDRVYARSREDLNVTVGRLLMERNLSLAVAESCTAGMLSAFLTHPPGSSRFFKGGCVAYANEVKISLLKVPPETLNRFGAVSKETAMAMADGIRKRLAADFGLSVTGIAGPGGGTREKPVGLVWIGLADQQEISARPFQFGRDRALNREWSVQRAVDLLRRSLS